MKKFKYIFFAILVFFVSCSVKEKLEIKSTGDLNDAITNVIIDFSQTDFSKKRTFYYVRKDDSSNKLFSFSVSDRGKINFHLRDSIGVKTKYFPTRFKEINKRLYIWEDSTIVLSSDFMKKLQEYEVLDSTFYKMEKGLIPIKPVYFTSNELKKAMFYYVCKSNISKFVKINRSKVYPVSKYPEVDCN
jgi:hypothetical protein